MTAIPYTHLSLHRVTPSDDERRIQQREEALQRLILTLEAAASSEAALPVHRTYIVQNAQNQLTRLRVAHATYALASAPLQSAGRGAWMRRAK